MASLTAKPDSDPGLRQYLWSLYQGVFDEDAMEAHIRDYVGFTFADQMAPQVAKLLEPGANLLDLGCGFGAFVIAARRLGLQGFGLELAKFEVSYARSRLADEFPELNPEDVFIEGDAQILPYAESSFDAVTMWNLLEHVPDTSLLLKEAKRVLRPGGVIFIICPNYGAFSREAHYLVPWIPFLPKKPGTQWLRLWGKNPAYFERGIFPLSNWKVLRDLAELGLKVADLDKSPPAPRGLIARERLAKLSDPQKIQNADVREMLTRLQRFHLVSLIKGFLKMQMVMSYALNRIINFFNIARRWNPLKKSVCLLAIKK